MTTQEHLHRERESHGLLPGQCLPHKFLIRPEFLACHKSALLPGLIDLSLVILSVNLTLIGHVQESVLQAPCRSLPSP
jgi:hypothetical protein